MVKVGSSSKAKREDTHRAGPVVDAEDDVDVACKLWAHRVHIRELLDLRSAPHETRRECG